MENDKVEKLRLKQISERDHIRQGSNKMRFVKVTPFRGFDLSEGWEQAATACCDPAGWASAIGMLEAIADKGRQSGQAKALYVIGVDGRDDVAKIGISANPIKRLGDLQGAHYRKLYLHAICFAPTRKACTVEQFVLDCEERMEGEWLNLSPDEVLKKALDVSEQASIPLVDGATWFADMTKRTYELARASKLRKCA